jgi:hypothetical protein
MSPAQGWDRSHRRAGCLRRRMPRPSGTCGIPAFCGLETSTRLDRRCSLFVSDVGSLRPAVSGRVSSPTPSTHAVDARISEHLRRADARLATTFWHWFFFAKPDTPERVINADPTAGMSDAPRRWARTATLNGAQIPAAPGLINLNRVPSSDDAFPHRDSP